MHKDPADLFAAKGQEARQILKDLKDQGVDGLEFVLQGIQDEPSKRRRLKYVRENVFPLLLGQLEAKSPAGLQEPTNDPDVLAALDDIVAATKLKLKALKAAIEDEAQRRRIQIANADKRQAMGEQSTTAAVDDEQVENLISSPGVLERYVEDVARIHGVVKDRAVLRLQTLVALGAQLEPLPNGKPAGANLILIAEAGRGKNYVCDAVANGLPEGFCLPFESASGKSLFYKAAQDPSILEHVWIYPNEAEATDQLTEMFRPLLSGGKASHLTVNRDADGRNTAQELVVKGPVSITIPTVRNKLDGQLQTRMLVSELQDYEGRVAAHSRALSRQLLPNRVEGDHTPKIWAWQAALRSLTDVRRVVFCLEHEGFCLDSDGVSHGARLWGNLLGLMLSHAWLEQRNREIVELSGGERAVVATPEDYEAAYYVFETTCERSIINLSDTHRKILDAVHELRQESGFTSGFSQRKIAVKAGVSVSTVSEHKTFLTKSAKLLYEDEGGLTLVADAKPSWWEKGDLLVGFPRPEQVRKWWEESNSVSTPGSAEHTERPDDEGQKPLTNAESGVRHSSELPSNVAEHFAGEPQTNGGVRRESGHVRQGSEHENDLEKPKSASDNLVFGVFGDFEDEERPQAVAKGLQRLFEEHPEYRKQRPGQIACQLRMGRYTPFVPTDAEVEAAIKEAP